MLTLVNKLYYDYSQEGYNYYEVELYILIIVSAVAWNETGMYPVMWKDKVRDGGLQGNDRYAGFCRFR